MTTVDEGRKETPEKRGGLSSKMYVFMKYMNFLFEGFHSYSIPDKDIILWSFL